MYKKIIEYWAARIMLLCALGMMASLLHADEPDAKVPASQARMSLEQAEQTLAEVLAASPSKKGADTCLKCHDEDSEYPVMALFKTKHATATDPRSPFADDQCESCHGPGGDHEKATKGDEEKDPIINFGKDAWTPVKDQNALCLSCHRDHHRVEWKRSSHEFNDVGCASCHKIHVASDAALEPHGQAEVCFSCHASVRAKFYQRSHHPVLEGQMTCSDCHDVHVEEGSGLTVAARVREKCTSCHAEKRGPLLWEHAPVAEDCTICHTNHGSNLPTLLTKRAPQLCQQCHAQAGHPSVSYDGSRIPAVYLSVKGCINCHSQIHGSNHPSGVSHAR